MRAQYRGVGSCLWIVIVGSLLVPASAWGKCSDHDGDGYYGTAQCGSGTDCNDNEAAIHPGATELCTSESKILTRWAPISIRSRSTISLSGRIHEELVGIDPRPGP